MIKEEQHFSFRTVVWVTLFLLAVNVIFGLAWVTAPTGESHQPLYRPGDHKVINHNLTDVVVLGWNDCNKKTCHYKVQMVDTPFSIFELVAEEDLQ